MLTIEGTLAEKMDKESRVRQVKCYGIILGLDGLHLDASCRLGDLNKHGLRLM